MEWRDPEVLQQLYIEKGLSCREIGEELGCAARTVSRWLDRHGIEARDISEANVVATRKRPVPFETYEKGYERWHYRYCGDRALVRVHRLLAVAEYGFDAVAGMDVHHKNKIRWDNRPENIELIEPAEHSRLHAIENDLHEAASDG